MFSGTVINPYQENIELMKTIVIAAFAVLTISTAGAQTNGQQPRKNITGQDSTSWRQPRRTNPGDTPRNITPVPRNMQPKGVNPDSSRTPGSRPVMK